MRLFVYNWFYNGYAVHGHCLDEEGKYKLLKVRNFYPFCYVEGENVPNSTVVPYNVEHMRMVTSRDISTQRSFCRVYFNNLKDMTQFSSECRQCYMADIPPISTFLSQINADHVGWIKVNNVKAKHDFTDKHNLESAIAAYAEEHDGTKVGKYVQGEYEPTKYEQWNYGPDIFVNMSDFDTNDTSQDGFKAKVPFSNPRVLSFDIEVKTSDTGMPQPYRILDTIEMISIVAFGGHTPNKTYILHTYDTAFVIDDTTEIKFTNEIQLIEGLFSIIKYEDPTVITGFNIYGFDIQYIVSRLKLRLIGIPDVSRGIINSVDLIKVDWVSDAYGHNNYERLVIGGRVILDMYLYFKRMKLDRYSLDFISDKFIGDRKKDMSHAKMVKAFETKDPDLLREVAIYCIQDSVLVMKLFEKVQMWIDVCEISKITSCGIEDIYTRGEQMKLVSQCVRECTKRNIVLQPLYTSTWRQYEGGYVLEPKKGVYNGCSILDFQSLYPSIIIAYNICPSTYTRLKLNTHNIADKHFFKKQPIGLLPGMIKNILDERKAVKQQMSKVEDTKSVEYIVLDRRQNALKICANSVYGMMGFKNSRYFGHVGCAESVTMVGRMLLTDIVEQIESKYPVDVVYGDTDSCMLWHKDQKDRNDRISLAESICNDITSTIPSPMALKFEAYCDKIVLLTKKRYVIVTENKIRYKGVMNARRDYCNFAKNTYSHTIEMIAKGQSNDDIAKYVDNQILMLMRQGIAVHDLVVTKSLAKHLNTYKVNQPHVVLARRLKQKTGLDIPAGTRLEYVYVKGPISMVTPEEFTEDGFEINSIHYVQKQLATQIDELLSIIGLGNYINTSWLKK